MVADALITFVCIDLKTQKALPLEGELREKLEQLRALEAGYRIRVIETPYETVGVDTPEDLARMYAACR